MIWLFYNVLFTIGFLLLLPRFFLRMWKRGGYRRHFMQRLAVFDPATRLTLGEGQRVWIHAVSVGELYVALRFMDGLRKARPELSFVLSTTTSTGHAIARERIRAPDVLIYFPLDIPPVMRRMLGLIRPRMLVLVEGEFWPNLIRLCRRREIPVVLINGRISLKSYRGYALLGAFTRRLLPEINVMCMQSEGDRERLIALGAPPERVHVPGSAKYELSERDEREENEAREALRRAGVRDSALILLGGSTWPGEEDILLGLYKELREEFPKLFLVLVPRHVERSADVIETIERHGLSFVRRSALRDGPAADSSVADVLLVDTTGELKHFYASASVIFVGKSLTRHGGQNVIEPAVYRKPIVVGPNMENFPAIMEDFLGADALRQVRDVDALRRAVNELLSDEEERRALGERAGRLVQEKAGAVEKTLEHVLPLMVST
jgi:3-deoxy-D-manno-octulosonic-acid transferase